MGCGASKTVAPDTPSTRSARASTDVKADAKTDAAATDVSGSSSLDAGPTLHPEDSQLEEGAATRPADHISQAAVSLAYLQSFVQEHKLHQRRLTTTQVVAEIVKPATAASKCRFTDTLLADPAAAGAVSQGRPFFFVSHAWECAFTDTLDMLSSHFAPEQQQLWRRKGGQPLPPLAPEAVFLWLDVFAINQHTGPAEGGSDLGALWEAVQDAHATLMVLDPAGALLGRTWCLYEAWQSRKTGPNKLRLLSHGAPLQPLEQTFVGLDIAASQTSLPTDRDRLLDDIRRDVGSLDAMMRSLKDALVAGAVAQVPPEDVEWTDGVREAVATAGRLCELYGKLDQAEGLYRRELDAAEAAGGPDGEAAAAAVARLARVLRAQGNWGEAEPLYRQAMERNEQVLGPDHASTLDSLRDLASVLEQAGAYDDAEPVWRRAAEAHERTHGPDHAATLTCLHSLAAVLACLDRYDEAEPLYGRALEGRGRVLGTDHVDTLSSAHSLGYLLMTSGKYEEAEGLFRRALEGRERVLGAEHTDTAEAQKNLLALLRIKAMLGGGEAGGDGGAGGGLE